MKKTVFINKDEFLCYQFSSKEELAELGEEVLECLMTKKKFSISDIERNIGTLPLRYIENAQELKLTEDIEQISDYIIQWV